MTQKTLQNHADQKVQILVQSKTLKLPKPFWTFSLKSQQASKGHHTPEAKHVPLPAYSGGAGRAAQDKKGVQALAGERRKWWIVTGLASPFRVRLHVKCRGRLFGSLNASKWQSPIVPWSSVPVRLATLGAFPAPGKEPLKRM